MAYNTNITPGRPPVLWSEVNEAFVLINENFDIIAASLGPGIVPINFETLDTSVKPTTDNLYELGDITRRWRAVFVGEHTPFDIDNGVWLGTAQIKGVGTTTNLPAGSTVGGDPLTGIGAELIIDPNKTFFKEIQINNELSLVATVFGDTVNLLSSTGIGLAVNSSADSITVSNTGIIGVVAGAGISSVTAGGITTVANTGVLGLTNTGAIGARTAGRGIHVSSATGTPLITNTGIISVAPGSGITVSLDAVLGEVTITNTAPPPNAFTQIQINGDVPNRLVADLAADVLSINSGQGITLTKNASTDTFEITVDPVFDLRGSIFADDSSLMLDAVNNQLFAINGIFGNVTGNVIGNTIGVVTGNVGSTLVGNVTGNVLGNVTGNVLGNVTGDTTGYHTGDVTGSVFSDGSTLLVDGVSGKIVGDIETARLRTSETSIALGQNAGLSSQSGSAVAIGSVAGLTNQGASAIGIGFSAGGLNQGISAVAIGAYAGSINQGAYSIAIGDNAGLSNQPANSIVINASGSPVSNAAAGFYVRPIREVTGPQTVYYDPVTYEVTWGPVPAGGGGGGGDYEFKVAGDDSTQRVINNGETLQFIGAAGITTASDAEGKITITGPTLATVATTGSYSDLINQPVIPGMYEFKVAGDDSTQRVINNRETLQFIGAAGITTASDAEGTITISAAGVSGLASRTSAAASTGSIADAATATATITGFKGYVLYKIQTTAASWVRLYTDTASRTADASRLQGVDPAPDAGVIAEIITIGADTVLMSPGVYGFNNEGTPTSDIPINVTNLSGGTTTFTITLTLLRVEV